MVSKMISLIFMKRFLLSLFCIITVYYLSLAALADESISDTGRVAALRRYETRNRENRDSHQK